MSENKHPLGNPVEGVDIKKEFLSRLDAVYTDFEMLRNGDWEPDKSSIDASQENLERLLAIAQELDVVHKNTYLGVSYPELAEGAGFATAKDCGGEGLDDEQPAEFRNRIVLNEIQQACCRSYLNGEWSEAKCVADVDDGLLRYALCEVSPLSDCDSKSCALNRLNAMAADVNEMIAMVEQLQDMEDDDSPGPGR